MSVLPQHTVTPGIGTKVRSSEFGLQNYSHAATYSPARFGSISNSPRGHSEEPRCTHVLYMQSAGTVHHNSFIHPSIHPRSTFLLVRGMKVYQDGNQTCKHSSLRALTSFQLSPAVQFVLRLGLSPLR